MHSLLRPDELYHIARRAREAAGPAAGWPADSADAVALRLALAHLLRGGLERVHRLALAGRAPPELDGPALRAMLASYRPAMEEVGAWPPPGHDALLRTIERLEGRRRTERVVVGTGAATSR